MFQKQQKRLLTAVRLIQYDKCSIQVPGHFKLILSWEEFLSIRQFEPNHI